MENETLHQKIELEKEFIGSGEVKGFKFTQIHSGMFVSCYQVSISGNKIHFEVFNRKFEPMCIDFEKRIYSLTDFVEKYPKSNDFGKRAFTYPDLKTAMEKVKELEQQIIDDIYE